MKLNKENIYINLQGKSEEELMDLYNFLKLFNYDIDNFYSFLTNKYLHFNTDYNRWWTFSAWDKEDNKQEVTIQQLKEILQPMENKEPKSNELKALLEIYYSCRDKHTVINKDEIFKKYGCLNSEYMSVCLKNFNLINLKGRRSKWIASKPNENMADGFLIFVKDYVKTKNEKQYLGIKNNNLIEPSLTEQLEKAEAEVKRIEKEIEESKIKVGDKVFVIIDDLNLKVILNSYYEKIK